MPTCIYCRRADEEFDREHVIPEAFGTFEPTSFILYETVCKDCNNYFGRTIDFALSRDSMEALLRFRYGTKPASEAGDLPYRKIELKVGQPGPWYGATVVLKPDGTGKLVQPFPVPQAAFRWKGAQDWRFLVERELQGEVLTEYATAMPGALEIRAMGPSPNDHKRVLQKLRAAGIDSHRHGSLEAPVNDDGSVLIEIAAAVDQTILRAIAKIAFNYAAREHGAEFVLRSDFDDIRDYVRYGTAPKWAGRSVPVVLPFPEPILFDDLPQLRQTNGHLITFDWNTGRTGFVAQVALFNTITYHVAVCPIYTGLWHDSYSRGHHFDIEDGSISPLLSSSLVKRP